MHYAHTVRLNGRVIDTVFASYADADEMKRSLINHDGYDARIVVTCRKRPPRFERVNGKRIRCYDNQGATADRYTVVYMDSPERAAGTFECVGMDDRPFHPQGFGMHSIAEPGAHLGRRIWFRNLPADCQTVVRRDTE